MNSRLYVWSVLGFAAIYTMGVAAFNWVIDPYEINGRYRVAGLNESKTEFIGNAPLVKAYAIRRLKPAAIILGNSRTEHAIDPSHPGWSTGNGERYNLAYGGATAAEIVRYLAHAQAVRPLLQVVIGLDYFWFRGDHNRGREADSGRLFAEGKTNWLSVYLADLLRLTSAATLRSSVRTVMSQGSVGPDFDAGGRSTADLYERRLLARGGHHALFLRTARQCLEPAAPFDYVASDGRSTLDQFRALVRFSYRNRIDMRLFISPTHAWDMECMRLGGDWANFESWKKQLLQILREEAGPMSGSKPFPLWDFSGYHSVTTERIPKDGDAMSRMRWHWESSHYRQEVGDWVLDRLFDHRRKDAPVPEDFGVLLTPDNIDEQLQRTRDDQALYMVTHADEVRLLERIRSELAASARR